MKNYFHCLLCAVVTVVFAWSAIIDPMKSVLIKFKRELKLSKKYVTNMNQLLKLDYPYRGLLLQSVSNTPTDYKTAVGVHVIELPIPPPNQKMSVWIQSAEVKAYDQNIATIKVVGMNFFFLDRSLRQVLSGGKKRITDSRCEKNSMLSSTHSSNKINDSLGNDSRSKVVLTYADIVEADSSKLPYADSGSGGNEVIEQTALENDEERLFKSEHCH